MAEKSSEASGNGEEGREGVRRKEESGQGAVKEEDEKRRRGRPKKTGKSEEKEAGGLKNFLETGKITGAGKEIVKGNELKRTPVKKGLEAEDKEGNGRAEGEADDEEEARERGKKNEEKKKDRGMNASGSE